MNNTEDYLIRKWKTKDKKNSSFDIEQKNLTYAQIGTTHHGLQCNHRGGTKKYNEIMKLCVQITDAIKKIDELNTIKIKHGHIRKNDLSTM